MYADCLLPNAAWVTCPCYRHDGESNPDSNTDTANNRGAFMKMFDAILYNALAWAINGLRPIARSAMPLHLVITHVHSTAPNHIMHLHAHCSPLT
jgi:hypothetical protein